MALSNESLGGGDHLEYNVDGPFQFTCNRVGHLYHDLAENLVVEV